jgi:hypothetical protein
MRSLCSENAKWGKEQKKGELTEKKNTLHILEEIKTGAEELL